MDIKVIIKPEIWKEIFTGAKAPGPVKRGKANGMTPESSDMFPPNIQPQ